MSVRDRDPNEERVYGTELHPRHESWARISTRGTVIGFIVFLLLGCWCCGWGFRLEQGGTMMSRNRIEQHPDEYLEDLNPDYEAGENHGPARYETRPAYEIKEIHEQYPALTDDELKQIPVLIEGSRLEQGAKYLDLRNPQQGEFAAMGGMAAGPKNWYVAKSDVDHELWNLLTGVRDPYRLGEHAR